MDEVDEKKESSPNGARCYAWWSLLELKVTRKHVVGRGKEGRPAEGRVMLNELEKSAVAGRGSDGTKVERIMIDRSYLIA